MTKQIFIVQYGCPPKWLLAVLFNQSMEKKSVKSTTHPPTCTHTRTHTHTHTHTHTPVMTQLVLQRCCSDESFQDGCSPMLLNGRTNQSINLNQSRLTADLQTLFRMIIYLHDLKVSSFHVQYFLHNHSRKLCGFTHPLTH